MNVRDGNFVLLAISTSSKMNRREKNRGRCGLTTSFLCCYLNLRIPRVESPCRSQVYLFRSHVPKCQTRDLRYSTTLSIYLLPSRTLLHVSRSPESFLVLTILPRFASLSLIRVSCMSSCVSRSCPGKPYFGLPRYFNELIVIGTLSRSHESFLWYVPPCREGLPQNVTPLNVIRFRIDRTSDSAIDNDRETASIQNTPSRNFKLLKPIRHARFHFRIITDPKGRKLL